MIALSDKTILSRATAWKQRNVRIDEYLDVGWYTYHLPRALVIPMNQGHITEVPNPSLFDVLAGLLTLSQSHINVVCLCQTDPMGPRIVPILPGQGHIWLLTL